MTSILGALRSVTRRLFRTLLISSVLALCTAVIISTIAGVQTSEKSTQQLVSDVKSSTAELVANVEASTAAIIADIETSTATMVANIQAATEEMVTGVIEGAEETIALTQQLSLMIAVRPGRGGSLNEDDVTSIQALEHVSAVLPQYYYIMGQVGNTRVYDYIATGVVLDPALVSEYPVLPLTIIDGRQLEEGDDHGILVSANLLEFFMVSGAGDVVPIRDDQFEIIGVFYSTNPGEQKRVYMSLDGVQELFLVEDEIKIVRLYAESEAEVENVAIAIESLNSKWVIRTAGDRQTGSTGRSITQTQEQQIAQIQQQADQQITMLEANAESQIQSMLSNAELQTITMQRDAEFQVASLEDDLSNIESVGSLITRVVGIAGVLIIFGIMFYTVRERTKEIGILKALGFSNMEVMKRFMLEGLYIGLLGGLIGIILGTATYSMVGPWLLGTSESISISLEPVYLLMGLGAAVLFGTLGSLYPAWRASRISPMEAFRHR